MMPARKRTGSKEEALQHALRLLRHQARSEKEVRVKLNQSGFSQRSVDAALERLRSLHVLNDDTFARGWASAKAKARGYGPLRIDRELRQKGIAKSLIGAVLQETFAEQGEKERARELVEKRLEGKDRSDPRILRREADFLRRRGFHGSVIAELLGPAFDDE